MPIMTIEDVQRRVEEFLTGQMLHALHAVEYELPRFGAEPSQVPDLASASRARVAVRHVRGASDALYLIEAFGDELLMQLQLNVWRLVLVYKVPAIGAVDATALQPRMERWAIGAGHAGWLIGWRDAVNPSDTSQRFVETYCYANADRDFLENGPQQLYWRTDIVQMTRYFMIEARRFGIDLSPRQAGFAL